MTLPGRDTLYSTDLPDLVIQMNSGEHDDFVNFLVLRDLEEDGRVLSMGVAARAKYERQFSRQVVATAFESLLASA